MNHRNGDILIAGGGLGGLTAALALRRAGRAAVVLERAAELAAVQQGVGMVLWPNGMSALAKVGMLEQVEAIGTRIERVELRSIDGERLTEWPVAAVAERVGAPAVALSRADLHHTLSSALDGASLRLASECVGVAMDDEGVTVRTAGSREVRGSALVGADGFNSAVRAQLFGLRRPEFPPYAGYTLWHAIIPAGQNIVPFGVFILIFGQGSRFGCFRIDDDRAYWSAIAYLPEGGTDAEGERRSALLDLYRDYADPVHTLVSATPEEDVHRTDIFGGKGLAQWGTGRVTLLGDAAHPMTTNLGQGACMAIEDAVVLGDGLGRTDDVLAALRAYEERRIERVGRMMKLANRLNSNASLETPFRTWVRNKLVKRTFRVGIGKRYEALMTKDLLPG
jgi:2-polyprenyl-6-methoxyphenol hydroxylase-like FAD-dependent oxidoreductase